MIYTEWDPLRRVIVGSAYSTSFLKDFSDQEFVEGMTQILEETEEDLNSLAKLLEQHSVTVYRPPQYDLTPQQGTTWSTDYPYPPLAPRDFNLAYSNFLISTIGGDPNRINESEFFNPILLEYQLTSDPDYHIFSMPRPQLHHDYKSYSDLEPQILFHSANILKCGDSLLHTKPYNDHTGRGTYNGLAWLKKTLPRWINWIEIPAVGHADGKLALLKPGVLMCWDPKHIPQEMSGWKYIHVETRAKDEQLEKLQMSPFYKTSVKQWLTHWIGQVDETCFDINVISIDSQTVITNGYNKQVEQQLKQNGITMIPFNFRHKYFWDNGLHCLTLDLERLGAPESYV